MTLKTLMDDAASIMGNRWNVKDGRQIPAADRLALEGNEASEIEGTVLYADMNGSTKMVRSYKNWFSAEMYKIYLRTVSEVLRANGGGITAYDGDRVMAVFMGESKNTFAVKAGMQIVFAVNRLNDLIAHTYNDVTYRIKHSIGIDTGRLFAIRAGVRGANDVVWVGESANLAAKLTTLDDLDYPIWITKSVYDAMNDSVRYSASKNMWTEVNELKFGRKVYKTNWWWSIK